MILADTFFPNEIVLCTRFYYLCYLKDMKNVIFIVIVQCPVIGGITIVGDKSIIINKRKTNPFKNALVYDDFIC